MAESNYTFPAAFSQAILPRVLFDQSADQSSMLLARRYACPLLQHLWRQAAESLGISDASGAEAIDTSAVWLGGRLASMMVTLPAPSHPGEAHNALFVIPAAPVDGPRRYFLLERASTATANPAAVTELIDDPATSTGMRRIEHRADVQPTSEAFVAAVEQITGTVRAGQPDGSEKSPSASVPAADVAGLAAPGPRPWWQFWA